MNYVSKFKLAALSSAILLPLVAGASGMAAADLAKKKQLLQAMEESSPPQPPAMELQTVQPLQQKDPLDLLMLRLLNGEELSPTEKDQLAPRLTQPQVQPKYPGHAVDQVWGPDEFGYSAYDETEESGMAFDWIEHDTNDWIEMWAGSNADDSWTDWLDLGFNFQFYDDTVSQIRFSANAIIQMGQDGAQPPLSYMLPVENPDYRLIDAWCLDMYHVTTTYVGYAQLSDPDRFVMTWENLAGYSNRENFQTFQVILYADGNIQFQYGAMDEGGALCISSGIDHTGTRGLGVGDASTHYEGQSILFNMIPPEYAVNTVPALLNLSGGPGDVLNGAFTIINTGANPDSYELELTQDTALITLTAEGAPVSNTGMLQPDEEFQVNVTVEIDTESGTYTDLALVTVTSDNSTTNATTDIVTAVINAAGGGPDEWGNTWISSAGGDVDYFWVTLAEEDRTYATLSDDSFAGPFPINGALNFYGSSYSEFYVSSNGYYGFDNTSMNSLSNQMLPTASVPNNLLALFWDDLNPNAGGQVYYGNDDEGRLVITYDGIGEFGGSGLLTAQAVVDPANGFVYHNYQSMENGLDINSCTIGIENFDGSDGLTVLFNADPYPPAEEWTVRFTLNVPDYALALDGWTTLQGAEDSDLVTTFSVTNSGSLSDTYDLAVSAGTFFTYEIQDMSGVPISTIGPLATQESAEFQVVVTLPPNSAGQVESVTLSATSQGDDLEVSSLDISTTVVTTTGEDSYGNSWVSSYNADGPDYFFVELDPEDRNVISLFGGGVSPAIDMQGSVNFYGVPQNEIFVSSHGLLGFDPTSMGNFGAHQNLPDSNPANGLIALFWDDLNPNNSEALYYGWDEDGRFVVTWDDVMEYFLGPGSLRAQVVFDFANDKIFFNYDGLNGGLLIDNCTVGFEDYDGAVALNVIYNSTPWMLSPDLSIEFTIPPPPDYYLNLESGVTAVAPADSEASAFVGVTNIGNLDDSYTLTASATAGVEVAIVIDGTPGNTTPVISPDETFDIELVLTIPEIPTDLQSTITLTATSVNAPDTFDDTTVQLSIVTVQGGPDAYGYFWSTSNADGQVEYDWVEMENPTIVPMSDDDVFGPIELGFSWNHYGTEYTQVYFSSNGNVGFDPTGLTAYFNGTLPTANTPNNIIAWHWDDFYPPSGGTISYEVQDDMFILEFFEVPHIGGAGYITAQVILDTDEEAVRINYQDVENGLILTSSTIGMENAGGTDAILATFNGEGWLPSDTSALWFGLNVIGPSGPYAVDIDPNNVSSVGLNGAFAEYEFEVENRGENPSAFSIDTEGNAWEMTFHDIDDDWAEITGIPEIAYDVIFNLGVRVHVPEEPASFTDLAILTVASTVEPEMAFAETTILTSASCSHIEQVSQNVTGNGLFGMDHLSDGDGVDSETTIWLASGVNRMVQLNPDDGTVGVISSLPFGPLYLGIAHDSRDNSYWVSYQGGFAHVASNGSLIDQFSPALLDVASGRTPMGLAFDEDGEILWAICSHAAVDDVIRFDVSDASAPIGLGVANLPWSSGIAGAAGADYNEGSNQLIAVNNSTATMECFLDLGNGELDPRGDFCPSGLGDVHGLALHTDGNVLLSETVGLAHGVERYLAPCEATDVDPGAANIPMEFRLGANYPNPFNPSTLLRVEMPQAGHVRLEIFNLLGQRQSLLVNSTMPAGWHDVRFDGSQLSSGVYFYRVTVSNNAGAPLFSDVRKMMLMK